MSCVLGPYLDYKLIEINPGGCPNKTITPADPSTLSLWWFKFVVGDQDIYQGYDSDDTDIYTEIVFIFEHVDGYKNDLGTGLQDGAELGCLPAHPIDMNSNITYTAQKRLTCILHVSTGDPEDKPTVTVKGYDQIAANSVVELYVARLKSLPHTVKNTIKTGVRFIYKLHNNEGPFYYEPT